MLQNPLAIEPWNLGLIFSNSLVISLFDRQWTNHGRKIGAPMTLRRSIRNNHNSLSFVSSSSNNGALGYPKYERLLPCPSLKYPPRVEHLVVLEEGPVCDYISKTLNLPQLYVADLIHFGAVHYALVHPEPPATATPEQIVLYKRFTSPDFLEQRKSLKGKTVREAQKTFRIIHVDEYVEVGTYLRVYVHPRRFPRAHVGGTSNNIEETCANFVTRALGLTNPLLTTHQIDNCTEGCVVLARTQEYCSVFHRKIRDKMVKKFYHALLAAPVSCGLITHYMRPTILAPRIISEEYMEGWQGCQLEVLDCKEVPWPNSIIEGKYQIRNCEWPVKNFAYECKINLVTGRTHQIRAQLAARGAPIVGDSMYMPASLAEITCPGVNPFGVNRREYASEDDKRIAIESWIALHGKEPTVAIGLQASQISWDEGDHMYNAGTPWWSCT